MAGALEVSARKRLEGPHARSHETGDLAEEEEPAHSSSPHGILPYAESELLTLVAATNNCDCGQVIPPHHHRCAECAGTIRVKAQREASS